MRGSFSLAATSASTLALATAATLALPFSALAADFVYRDGQKVSTSLEAPDDGANLIVDSGTAELSGVVNETGALASFKKSGAGTLILTGQSLVTAPASVEAGVLNLAGSVSAPIKVNGGTLIVGGSVTNVTNSALGILINKKSVYNLTNSGMAVIEGSTYSADVLAGGTLLIKDGASVKITSSSGTIVNDGSMYILNQAAGSFANNAKGSVYGYSQNGGAGTNDGSMVNASVSKGPFTNNASGKIVFGYVNGGTFANSGKITSATVDAPGTLTNNATGEIERAAINGGILANGGKIKTADIKLNGTLTNNEAGVIDALTNNGTTNNAGLISNATTVLGNLTNSATGIIETLTHQSGETTNNGKITVATIETGTLTNNSLATIAEVNVKDGTLSNSGIVKNVTIAAGGALTNNLTGDVTTLNNAGTITNAGQLGAIVQTTGVLTNNGTILGEATINGGDLTNNNAIGGLTIASDGKFINNQNAAVRAFTNSGTTSNGGAINTATQLAGTLINSATGTLSGLFQSGGTSTNNGTIENTDVSGGTLVNNKSAKLGQTRLMAGTLDNSGAIASLNIGKDGLFTNTANGTAALVSSLGQGTNNGTIGNLQIDGGQFENAGVVTENTEINAGVLTSAGLIGGKLIARGGTTNLSGSINGGVNNAVNSTINLRGKLNGGGEFINEGTVRTFAPTEVSGFNNFKNSGTVSVNGNLNVDGDFVSSGNIEMSSDVSQFETLKVSGNFTLTDKSATFLNINADGSRDALSAGGNLNLGGTLNVAVAGEGYGLKSTFDMFTSTAGTVAGNFSNVIVSGAKNLFGIVETANSGKILAIRNRDVLNTQLAALNLGDQGKILNDFNYSGKDGADLFDALATLKSGDAPGLMSQITGASISAVANAGSSAAESFGHLMQKVATASGLRRSGDNVLAYQKAMAKHEHEKFAPVLRQGQSATGFWVRGYGETGSSAAGGGANLGGLGAGADVALYEKLTVGVSAGYSMARFGHNKAIKGETNSIHGGAYVAYGATAPEATGFGVTASGSFSKHETKTNRTFNVGTLSKVAYANYGGTTIAGEVMVRHGITLGDTVPLTIAPIAGVKFSMDNDDAYTESGVGVLNQTVSAAKSRSLKGVVGLQLASRIETESVVFIPHVSATYQHEFMDTSSTTTRTLAGSLTPFTAKQGGGSRSAIAMEAGLGLRFGGGLAVELTGYGVISSDEKRYGATATMKAGF